MNVAYNMDCMEYMRTLQDKAFDLAVVDPPYFSGPERRGYYGCKISPIGVKRDYPVSPKWDIPDAEFLLNWIECQSIISYGAVTTLISCFLTGESCGTSAMGRAASAIAKLRRRTALKASVYSAICGMGCSRGRVLQRGQSSRGISR